MTNSLLLAMIAEERRRDFRAVAREGRLVRLARCCQPAALGTAFRAALGVLERVRSGAAPCCA